MNSKTPLRLRLSRQILIIAVLPTCCIAATMLILLVGLHQVDALRQKQHMRRVAVQEVARLLPDRIVDAANAMGATGDPGRRKDAAVTKALWSGVLGELDNVSESPRTHEAVRKLAAQLNEYETSCMELAVLYKNHAPKHEKRALLQKARALIAGAPGLMHVLFDATEEELQGDAAKMGLLHWLRWIAVGGFGATCLASLASVDLSSSHVNRRLSLLSANARRLSAGEPLAERSDGVDEIAQLDRNFHDMAAALEDARREEQAAISNSADLIFALDDSFVVLDVNPACKTILGVPREAVVGQSTNVLLAPAAIEQAEMQLAEMKSSGELRLVETQLRTADGTLRDALLTGFYSAEDKSMFCIVHDISRRKEVERLVAEGEAKERLLMERVPAGLLTFGKSGVVRSANRRAAELLGLAEITGIGLNECFGASAVAAADFVEDLLNKSMGKVCTTTVQGRVFEISVSAVRGQADDEYLAVILDQTEREQFKQMRTRFVSMIAHDIATPLTNIGGTFMLFAAGVHGELNEAGLKKVQTAEAESQRLVRLFRDLLRAEKHGDVQLEIGASSVELRELVQQAVSGVSDLAERQGVALAVDGPECAVRVDSDRMVQVFVNLLTNALKFSPAGSRVDVAIEVGAEAVRVLVSDEGPGIPENMLQVIFEPFKQVSPEDATVRGGSGLGLAICKQIVLNHGGRISATNRNPHGAVFAVELPL